MVDQLLNASPTIMSRSSDPQDPEETESQKIFGILKYPDNNIYEGHLVDGKRNGQGNMIFSNGDRYQGLWKNDCMVDSNGVFTFKNGIKYTGSFDKSNGHRFGTFNGKGSLIFPKLGSFVGHFTNGLSTGYGTFSLEGSGKTSEVPS